MFRAKMLSQLNLLGSLLNCVLNLGLKFFYLWLSDPVLETSFDKVQDLISQMLNPCLKQQFTLSLEINYFFPFSYSTLSIRVVEPSKSICKNPLSLIFQLSLLPLIFTWVLGVLFAYFAQNLIQRVKLVRVIVLFFLLQPYCFNFRLGGPSEITPSLQPDICIGVEHA